MKNTILILFCIITLLNCAQTNQNKYSSDINETEVFEIIRKSEKINFDSELLQTVKTSNTISAPVKLKFFIEYYNKLKKQYSAATLTDVFFQDAVEIIKIEPSLINYYSNDIYNIFFKLGNYSKTVYWINAIERNIEISTALIELKCYSYYYLQNIYDLLQYYNSTKHNRNFGAQFQQFIEKISREFSNEINFRSQTTRNFDVYYTPSVNYDLIKTVSDNLEDAVNYVNNIFGWYPHSKITVMIYDINDYRGYFNTPEWSAGLFDGKIRIPVYANMQPAILKSIIFHEYTHSAHYQIAGGSLISYWLAEGLAKYIELTAGGYTMTINNPEFIPLNEIDNTFTNDTGDYNKILCAYYESYLIVKYIAERFGQRAVGAIISNYSKYKNIDISLKREIFMDVNELFVAAENYVKNALLANEK